ncbi:DUF4232 domain-containing protein [Streptomyces sp. NPDC006296]|uniref:DUF4232 domain-containing protein n=1 Tax=Streptomyces sp. NPDC006296 TaxID=3156746 RepID=UPI0033A1B1B5
MSATAARLATSVAVGAALVLGLTGAATASAPSREAKATACTGTELRPTLVHGTDADPDPEAVQTTALLLFTNVGERTCTVQGYPGLDLVDADGEAWSMARQQGKAEKVTLKPGVATMAELTFLPVSPGSSAPDEEAFVPVSVKVTPPDTTRTTTLSWPWKDIAVLDQTGSGRPGTYIGTVFGTASS